MYEKADYFKIKDITLAYNLPKSFINKFGVDNVKIYGSLKNYFNFSRVSNYDSERGGSVSLSSEEAGSDRYQRRILKHNND